MQILINIQFISVEIKKKIKVENEQMLILILQSLFYFHRYKFILNSKATSCKVNLNYFLIIISSGNVTNMCIIYKEDYVLYNILYSIC